MDIQDWLDVIYPEVSPDLDPRAPFIAHIKTRTPEHNPPLFWLGCALDEISATNEMDTFIKKARNAIGDLHDFSWNNEQACLDVFSQACAFAWASKNLSKPQFMEQRNGEYACIFVPDYNATIVPKRIRHVRHFKDIVEDISSFVNDVQHLFTDEYTKIGYLDTYLNLDWYAQDLGYRLELTEPLVGALKNFTGDQDLRFVLTRPFQWGNPVASWY